MSGDRAEEFGPGVYCTGADDATTLVHIYQGGPYRMIDMVDFWSLGRIEGGAHPGESVVVVTRQDVPRLKTMADAFSFDYDQGFIEMCLEMHRYAMDRGEEKFRFVATF